MQFPSLLSASCVILGGLLVPLGFAPFNLYFLPVLSLAILFYFWSKAVSGGAAFVLGYLFGLAMFGLGVNWLHISLNLFGGINLAGALLLTLCFIMFISLFPALCGYLCVRFFNGSRVLACVSLWTIAEWCRGWFLTGFPWLNLGTSQIDSPLVGFIPVVGEYGATLIVCALALALILLLTGKTKTRYYGGVLWLCVIMTAWLLKDFAWTDETGDSLSVALIQGAIPQELKWKPEMRQNTYDIYTHLSEPYWGGDLIIWPETAIPSLYHHADDFVGPVTSRQAESEAFFMSGLAYKSPETEKYFNSILLVDDGHYFYNKHHLVPFGEYLPLRFFLAGILNFLNIPMSDFSPSDIEEKHFRTAKGVFGMSICYEDAYGAEMRRVLPEANILINVSNDAWFGDSFAPHQHLQIARMRALESGRYLLRAANTGISAVVNEKGKVIARSPQFEPHALQANARLFEGATPYVVCGNSLVLIVSVLLLLISRMRERRFNPMYKEK